MIDKSWKWRFDRFRFECFWFKSNNMKCVMKLTRKLITCKHDIQYIRLFFTYSSFNLSCRLELHNQWKLNMLHYFTIDQYVKQIWEWSKILIEHFSKISIIFAIYVYNKINSQTTTNVRLYSIIFCRFHFKQKLVQFVKHFSCHNVKKINFLQTHHDANVFIEKMKSSNRNRNFYSRFRFLQKIVSNASTHEIWKKNDFKRQKSMNEKNENVIETRKKKRAKTMWKWNWKRSKKIMKNCETSNTCEIFSKEFSYIEMFDNDVANRLSNTIRFRFFLMNDQINDLYLIEKLQRKCLFNILKICCVYDLDVRVNIMCVFKLFENLRNFNSHSVKILCILNYRKQKKCVSNVIVK